jgi:hypothetical protein
MPTLAAYEGIKINVYFGEHLPPHVHAVYGENEALLTIVDGGIYGGSLPVKPLKKAQKWLTENREETLEVFLEFNPHLKNEKRNKKSPKNIKNKPS